jgi:hypothetical protein
MKKNSSKSSVVTAAVIGIPLAALPSAANAQTPTPISKTSVISTVRPVETSIQIKFAYKSPTQATLVGMSDGHPVYTNERGEYFYLDAATGDFKYLTRDQTAAFTKPDAFGTIKLRTSTVTLVGIDANGNVLQKNAAGETFYLNAKTGDMVFVK